MEEESEEIEAWVDLDLAFPEPDNVRIYKMTPPGMIAVSPATVFYAIRYGFGRKTEAHYDALKLVREHWSDLEPFHNQIVSDMTAWIQKEPESLMRNAAQKTLEWVASQLGS